MQPIIKTGSVLLVAQLTHLKKWLLAKHIKYIHPEERRSNSSDKNYDQPQIEDQIRHNEYIEESGMESIFNDDLSSHNKHTPRGASIMNYLELIFVICQKKIKKPRDLGKYKSSE